MACAAAEVREVDLAALRLLGEALREVERLVEDRLPERLLLAHVGEDGALGARGEDRLDRIDLVRARVLAEPEEDHPVAVCHDVIIAGRPGVRAATLKLTRARDPVPPPKKGGDACPPPSAVTLAGPGAQVCAESVQSR